MAFTDFASKPWKPAFAFGLAALGVILVLRAETVLLLAFLGLVLGVLFDAIAEFGIRHLRLGRGVAVVLAAVLFLLGLGGALMLIAAPLLREGTDLVQTLPKKTEQLSRSIEQYRQEFPLLKGILPGQQNATNNPSGPKPAEAAKTALVTASSALEWAARLLATFFFGLFLAWNPERWMRGVAELGPKESVERHVAVFKRIGAALRSYLFTIAIYMVAMAVLWTLGLWLIGIEFALLFGVIGGLVEVVPYLGPVLGVIPPLLYAVGSGGGMKALYVLLLYTVLHIVEGYILVPYVMHERERLPPPLVVFSILLAGTLFGTLGVLLAVPLGTVAYVWIQETARRSVGNQE